MSDKKPTVTHTAKDGHQPITKGHQPVATPNKVTGGHQPTTGQGPRNPPSQGSGGKK